MTPAKTTRILNVQRYLQSMQEKGSRKNKLTATAMDFLIQPLTFYRRVRATRPPNPPSMPLA
jgi:hypothetical protein